MTERNCTYYVLASILICLISVCSCGVKPQLEPATEMTPSPSLMDIAPADALLVLQIKDVAEALALIEDSRAWQQLLEAPIWELLRAVYERKAEVKDIHHLFRPSLSILSHLLGQEILLVVPKFREPLEFSPTLMADLDRSDDLGEILSAAIKVAMANIPEAKTQEYNGYSYMTAEFKPNLLLSCGLIDNFLIASLGETSIRRAIDLYQGKSDASLAKNPNFAQHVERCQGAPGEGVTDFQSIFYLDFTSIPELVELMYPMVRGEMSDEIATLADRAIKWLDLVQWVGSVTNLTKDGIVSQSYIKLNPNATANNFLEMLLAKPTRHDSIKFAPTDVISYSAFNLLDLPKLWQMVMGFVESMPPEMSREVLGSLQEMETMMGIDIEYDLLSWMGNEIALLQTGFTMLSPRMGAGTGGAIPQLLLSIQTSDSEKAAQSLGRLTDVVAMTLAATTGVVLEWDTVDYAGNQIRTAALPNVPYQPSYVVTEQYVLISTGLAELKVALDCASGTATNLLTATEFVELRGIAPELVNNIAYAKLARLLEQMVDTVAEQLPVMFENGDSKTESELIQSMLPSTMDFVREIVRTLVGQIQYTVNDGDGLRSYSFLKVRDLDANFEWADSPDAKSARLLLMARVYQGMPNRALTYLDRVLAIDPNQPDALKMKISLLE